MTPPGSADRPPDDAAIGDIFREEYGRVVATLVGRFGDIDLAEDVAQEAFVEAIRRWPEQGLPPNPGGWLTLTARNRAIDRLRRDAVGDQRQRQAHHLQEPTMDDPADTALGDASSLTDDRLQLIFTCCHPALNIDARVALSLRLLGGLAVPEIAAAFLVPDTTMGQRITRAKKKIRLAKIPYRVPADHELPQRLPGVLATVYLIFNEGYVPTADREERADLAAEAIRLGRLLAELMPDEPEVLGLLALMLLIESRRPARIVDGVLVRLDEQDRSRWSRSLIDEGQLLVRRCLARGRPGPHQLQAAIQAIHAQASSAADTDWHQIKINYDMLYAIAPSPVIALNRAVAVAEVAGPEAGLAAIDPLAAELDRYGPFHVARADLLRRLDRPAEAVVAYDRALATITNPAQLRHLRGRRAELDR
ncbi:RNA polymerase sigma factor [Propionibacteriaceae bacterium Y2011]|uniref:RNA polymerase sigma factor n=1 Tax=Microlunatus sp. Y2014 TaxID=3418488 RepID=UPI003B46BC56